METYVVRIYRRESETVVGVIESIDGKGSRPFSSLDELRALLEKPFVRTPGRRRRKIPPPSGGNPESATGDGNGVHRLHQQLRQMSAAIVDSPSAFRSAPGYYAVYFTDEPEGIKLEYVHVSG